ncbi:MAG: hypothetical protein J6M05_05395 [Cardiobacteriaceae bacterium]|nr:hypothetical protein [Cardiobacteriaceae bacterium]
MEHTRKNFLPLFFYGLNKAEDAAKATKNTATGVKNTEKSASNSGKTNKNETQAVKDLTKTKIETGKQNKHIEGTNEYKTAGQNNSRSILTADPQSLTSKFGTGEQIGNI